MDFTFDMIGRVLVAGGGGAVITLGILRVFCKGWLDQFFDKRKALFKSEQDKALIELKHVHDETLKDVQKAIDKDLHRARKLYDREFDVLTEALEHLARAYDVAEKFVGEMVPQIHQMSDTQRNACFESDELAPWQIENIMKCADKEMTDAYMKIRRQKRYAAAQEDARALLRCIALKNVFMADGLKERFQKLHAMISAALIEQIVGYDHPELARYEKYTSLCDEGRAKYAELEALVRERLWSV